MIAITSIGIALMIFLICLGLSQLISKIFKGDIKLALIILLYFAILSVTLYYRIELDSISKIELNKHQTQGGQNAE